MSARADDRPAPHPAMAGDAVLGARGRAPSHLNRVVDAVRRSSVPAPIIYGLVWLAFVAVEIAAKAADCTVGDLRLIHVVLPTFAMAAFPAFHFFTDQAARALETARPLLRLSGEEIEAFRRDLTVLPAGPTMVAAAASLGGLVLLFLIQPPDSFEVLGTMTSPLVSAVELTWQVLLWSGVGPVAFLIARQMMIVANLTTHHTRIDLFALGPIYAHSRLTAAHAIFTAAVVVVASLALSRLAGTVQWALIAGFALLLAGAAFVVPLWGAHRLIVARKAQHEALIGRSMERLVHDLETSADRSELAAMDAPKTALEALVLARGQVRSLSAWPWRPETLRGVVSALLLPLLIWAATRILEAVILPPT